MELNEEVELSVRWGWGGVGVSTGRVLSETEEPMGDWVGPHSL